MTSSFSSIQLIGGALLLCAAAVAHADPCKLSIEANDAMQFSARQLSVPAACTTVEISLHHSGKLSAGIMGHDWVLARDADMQAIVDAGIAAGPAHGYLPQNDKRIIAATSIVGGGETTTVQFNLAQLTRGVPYAFFCTSPGHSVTMRGRFVLEGVSTAQLSK